MSEHDDQGAAATAARALHTRIKPDMASRPREGRDHYPAAWSVVLGGGGIAGGQAVGQTSKSGSLSSAGRSRCRTSLSQATG